MILTVHNLAENYKCLPSEIMARANTFDLYVLDVHTKWVKYQHELQTSGNGHVKPSPKPNQAQMLDMIKRVRSGK